jgi:hypothetical protein
MEHPPGPFAVELFCGSCERYEVVHTLEEKSIRDLAAMPARVDPVDPRSSARTAVRSSAVNFTSEARAWLRELAVFTSVNSHFGVG